MSRVIAPTDYILRGAITGQEWARFLSRCSISTGIYHYEILLLTDGGMRFGWAGKRAHNNQQNEEVFSIGFDGFRRIVDLNSGESSEAWRQIQRSATQNLPTRELIYKWQIGDIVGCLLDVTGNVHKFHFYLNGHEILYELSGNRCFRKNYLPHKYHAAIVLTRGQRCQFNFGQHRFRHLPQTFPHRIKSFSSRQNATSNVRSLQLLTTNGSDLNSSQELSTIPSVVEATVSNIYHNHNHNHNYNFACLNIANSTIHSITNTIYGVGSLLMVCRLSDFLQNLFSCTQSINRNCERIGLVCLKTLRAAQNLIMNVNTYVYLLYFSLSLLLVIIVGYMLLIGFILVHTSWQNSNNFSKDVETPVAVKTWQETFDTVETYLIYARLAVVIGNEFYKIYKGEFPQSIDTGFIYSDNNVKILLLAKNSEGKVNIFESILNIIDITLAEILPIMKVLESKSHNSRFSL